MLVCEGREVEKSTVQQLKGCNCTSTFEVDIVDSKAKGCTVLRVPTTSIGWLIGKNGRHVNMRQIEWNVIIQVTETKDPTMSEISVVGSMEDRQTCALILKGKIEYFLRR